MLLISDIKKLPQTRSSCIDDFHEPKVPLSRIMLFELQKGST